MVATPSSVFDGPFEHVEFHDGEQEGQVQGWLVSGQFFEERELDAITGNFFDSAQPDAFAVAQFVELTGLGAKHAAEVMSRVTFHDGTISNELFNEKPPAHGEILSQVKRV
jgi:hypothetical protein